MFAEEGGDYLWSAEYGHVASKTVESLSELARKSLPSIP